MKIRFSKTMAAVLAATTVTAVSGISALAAVSSVVTTTNYKWAADDTTITDNVSVTSTVTAATTDAGKQITYLVATATPTETGAIKYIDQAPVGSDGTVSFTFSAPQNTIYNNSTISAKFGSDAGYSMPDFTFAKGVDYYSTATKSCTVNESDITVDTTNNKTTIIGTLNGEVSAYGVTIDGVNYPAMGTLKAEEGGKFAVVIYGWQYSNETVAGYCE